MTKEKFLQIKNKYNIPGYTDEQIRNYLGDDDEVLVSKCPVCGNLYGDDLENCKMCGYDPEIYMNAESIKYLREDYTGKRSKDPDYIWSVTE